MRVQVDAMERTTAFQKSKLQQGGKDQSERVAGASELMILNTKNK